MGVVAFAMDRYSISRTLDKTLTGHTARLCCRCYPYILLILVIEQLVSNTYVDERMQVAVYFAGLT